jgi:predicted Zn-dependent peptidase
MQVYKYLILPIISLFLLNPAFASDGTTEFEVDGLKVILKPSTKEVISVNLVAIGGTANYSKEKEGVEYLTYSLAIEGGTKSMDKTAFKTAAEKIGASFGGTSSYDYGRASMTCLKMYWDESWDLFADAMLEPAFDAEEVNIVQEQLIAGAKSKAADPDDHLRNIAMQHVFEGRNYSKVPEGTAESLATLSLQDVLDYHAATMVKEKVFLVVVGDVDPADLKAKIKESFAKIPQGDPAKFEEPLVIDKTSVYIEDRDIATNYIRGVMNGPKASSSEAVVMRVAMAILRDRYFVELRTKRSQTYAPAAFYAYSVTNNPYNVVYASTQKPKEAMDVMVAELDKIKKEGFSQKELTDKKQTFLTYHFMGMEETSSQAQNLIFAELAGGWENANNFTDEVNAIDLETLNAVFNKYTKHIKWTYLGKESDVSEDDFPQVEAVKTNRPK